MNGATTLGYWVEAPARGALRAVALPAVGSDDVELDALFTGVSPGTERLVGRGLIAADATAMVVPGMQGSFALPVSYGYSFVGAVSCGPHRGRRAFTMQPHQQRAVVPASRCVWLPDDVPSPRATLFPNLETAQNAVWDAELAPGETVAVIGAGAVGLLVAFVLAQQHPGGDVLVVEADSARRSFAAALPWVQRAVSPEELPRGGRDVVFHATGTGRGLQLAIDALGFEGRVLELSWYGTAPVTLQLGGAFHHQRQRIVGSQVGTIAKSHRAAGHGARTAAVLRLLQDTNLDRCLREPLVFDELPDFFARLYRGEPTTPCPVVGYATRA